MTRPSSAKMPLAVEARVIDPLAGPQWDHWVSAHPGAGPFHFAAWFRVLSRTYGHQPRCLALLQGSRPVALFPLMEVASPLTGRRGICLPFADACEPLLFEHVDHNLVLDVLSRLAAQWNWRHVEVRGSSALPAASPTSVEFIGHELDLRPGLDPLMAGFEPSVRRALRKAEASGVTTEICTDAAAVRTFRELHAVTRRRHGLPPQPDSFFDAIQQEFLEHGHGAVAVASRAGTPVSAAVFLCGGSRSVYKFGASNEDAVPVRANNLAMWHGIRWLVSQGIEHLDFGRTSVSQHGLRRFKRGWGATECPIHYHQLSPTQGWQEGRDRAAGLHTTVFSCLPLSLNRLLGAALYPHLD